MTDRDWFCQFEAQARAVGDEQRLRLVQLVYEADLHREINPDRMLGLIEEGRSLARRLAEPWWALFYDDRRAGALMKYKGDAVSGLELAVRNALEARKPAYERFPWRFRIFDHLVVAYLNTDPAGYARQIREALDWLAQDVPPDGSPKYLLLARRRWLASELGDADEAEALAKQALAMAAGDADQITARSHAVFCYSHLCEIARGRGDWENLHDLAIVGEELARQVGHQLELAEFQMWQALVALREGRPEQARRRWRQATRRLARLGMPADHIYFDALCAYHEQGGELELALQARAKELELLVGKGRFAAELRCRFERLRLLARLGREAASELAEARAVARRLRRPEEALARLGEIGKASGGR
jgi:hypothetical protein